MTKQGESVSDPDLKDIEDWSEILFILLLLDLIYLL